MIHTITECIRYCREDVDILSGTQDEYNEEIIRYLGELANPLDALVRQGASKPCQKGDKYEKFKDFVLEKEHENKIIMFAGTGEIMEADIDEFIKQPAEGILYDLNRNKTTVLAFIEEQKWVNDYALSLVVEKLKALLDA